jgi:hypothetical protein
VKKILLRYAYFVDFVKANIFSGMPMSGIYFILEHRQGLGHRHGQKRNDESSNITQKIREKRLPQKITRLAKSYFERAVIGTPVLHFLRKQAYRDHICSKHWHTAITFLA